MTLARSSRRSLILAAAAGLVSAPARAAKAPPAGVLRPPPLLGSVRAPKRFILWGSYTCPYTAQLVPILKAIQADNAKRVAVEWRHFPLHPPDPALHVASMAAAKGRAWDFTFSVLEDFLTEGQPADGPKLLALLKACGGDQASLDRALAAPESWAMLKRDMLAGQLLGVTATPALFIDGYFLTPDGLPTDLKGFEASLRAIKGVS